MTGYGFPNSIVNQFIEMYTTKEDLIIIMIMNHFYKAHITIYISSLCALGRKKTEKRTV